MSRRINRAARRASYRRMCSYVRFRRRALAPAKPKPFAWPRALVLVALPTALVLAAAWMQSR
jgi:hypothetical protein